MINFIHPSTAPENQSKRLTQLDGTVELQEWRILRENRRAVQEFVRLGQKWGFFALDEKTSQRAGREIMINAFMPESNLAALIKDRNAESLSVLERTIDKGMETDPKYIAGLLISRIDTLHQKESNEYGTVALSACDSQEMLNKEIEQIEYLRWVNAPAPVHQVPTWFLIIKKHGMGPADLEMIYERMDRERAGN